jgi:hypothetical protein
VKFVRDGLHIYIFGQWQKPGKSFHSRIDWPSTGLTIRARDPRGRTNRWRHFRIRLGMRAGSENGRGIMQFEIDSWLTKGTRERISRKLFFRIKAGLGLWRT